jgi:hypothetical protein
MPSALEATQKEYERWRLRERRLVTALEQVDEERRRLDGELVRVEQQVAYYDNLTRDMKKELGRPGLGNLLSSLRKS